jgi:hypothetical protein
MFRVSCILGLFVIALSAQTPLTYPATVSGSIPANNPGVRYLLPETPDDVITLVISETAPTTSAQPCVRVSDANGNSVLGQQCAVTSSTETFRIFRSQMLSS